MIKLRKFHPSNKNSNGLNDSNIFTDITSKKGTYAENK